MHQRLAVPGAVAAASGDPGSELFMNRRGHQVSQLGAPVQLRYAGMHCQERSGCRAGGHFLLLSYPHCRQRGSLAFQLGPLPERGDPVFGTLANHVSESTPCQRQRVRCHLAGHEPERALAWL
jgi:hypothetical protein